MAETVRWGVLGTAAVAEKHFVPAVTNSPNCELGAVASRDLARAEQFAAAQGFPRAYGSYDELLADPDVDAVYLPLPISLHAEWSIRCAEAGKPTLCEKPLARTAQEARCVLEAFAERDVPLAEGLMYRFHPITRRVRRMVLDGAVGKVLVMNAVFCCKIEREDDIRFRRETGGGALLDVGGYCVSVMRLLTGEEPRNVSAAAEFGAGGVDESLVGTLHFPSGAVGSFGCALRSEFGNSYEVFGTDGRIFVPQGVVPNPGDEGLIRYWKDYACEEIVTPGADQWQLMVEDFADALLEGRPPRFSPEDAVHNLEAIDRLLASARAGAASEPLPLA